MELKIATKRGRSGSLEGYKCRICDSPKSAFKKHLVQKILAPLEFAFFN